MNKLSSIEESLRAENNKMNTHKIKLIIVGTIFLWASAFVGIREGLHTYSPEGLALFRYLVASICMAFFYYRLSDKKKIFWPDKCILLAIGIIGIGIYNISLNYGELTVPSGIASFIVSQSPIFTTILAVIFLGESLTPLRVLGFVVSLLGVSVIAFGQTHGVHWSISFLYVLIATCAGGLYTVFQKPFLRKYHPVEATTYVIWGGTLFLMLYFPALKHDFNHASFSSTLTIIYLGIFPAAIAYVGWTHILSQMPASRAVSYLYTMPFVATFLGWICLGEVPVIWTLIGGLLAIIGVWLVNYSYQVKLKMA